MAIGGFGAVLAGLGDAFQRAQQDKQRQQMLQMEQAQLQERLKASQQEREATAGVYGAASMGDLSGLANVGGGSPMPSASPTPGPMAGAAPPPRLADTVKRFESGGNYNVGYGGADLSSAPRDSSGFPVWSGKQGPAGTSHAAGAYQFEPATWREEAAKAGVSDFSPASQDKVFAQTVKDKGTSPWVPFNPKLREAIGKQEIPAETHQEINQTAQQVAQGIPQMAQGGMDLRRLAQRIEKANPNADPVVKGMILERLHKMLAPSAQQQLELFILNHREAFQADLQAKREAAQDARQEKSLTAIAGRQEQGAETKGWQIIQDGGKTYRVNPNTGEKAEVELSGGAHKLTGGTPRSGPAMAAQKYLQEHPDATSDEIREFVAQTAAQTSATRGFDVGKQGDTVRSLNVAIDHLGVLQDAAEALQAGDVRRLNQASNLISRELGYPAPTDFGAVKSIVKDELVKAVLGGAGALGDRQEVEQQLDAANSPEQMLGVIRRYEQLMGGQMRGLKQQFVTSNAGDEAAFDKKLLPRTQEVIKRAGAPGQPGGGAPQSGGVPVPDNLKASPDGARFQGSDGKTYVKQGAVMVPQ